jgi:phosphohistidine phosphatase
MKNLILLRHAKSSWKDTSLDDFDRPLSNRGRKDAPKVAQSLKQKGIQIDLIISSSAKRTKETANIFADILNYNSEIIFDSRLYEASEGHILLVINQLDNRFENVLLVCHNPGITNLVNYLSDSFIENIPTSGIVGLLTEHFWREVNEKSCSCLFYDYPKKNKTELLD